MNKEIMGLFDRKFNGEIINILEILNCSYEKYDELLKEYLSYKENLRLKEKCLTGYASIDKPWEKYYSDSVLNFEIPKKTIFNCIYDNNKNYPDRIAISYYGNNITFESLFNNIDKTTKSLLALDVKKGDIVTLCLPTAPET